MQRWVALTFAVAALLAGCAQPESAPSPEIVDRWHVSAGAPRDGGLPQQVVIDGIGVKADVEAMGMAADGSQEVPDGLDVTGWWQDGSRPGHDGNVVLVGHTSTSGSAVFNDLHRLRRGDRVQLRATGGTTRYEVVSVTEVTNADFADHADQIYRTHGAPGLVLMTCSSWNGKSYESTTIVHARDLDRAPPDQAGM